MTGVLLKKQHLILMKFKQTALARLMTFNDKTSAEPVSLKIGNSLSLVLNISCSLKKKGYIQCKYLLKSKNYL